MWKSLLLLAALCAASAVGAQADYRNLDAGRPVAVEDAQPVEFRALDFSWAAPRFTRERPGLWSAGFEAELKWGIWKDTQVGITAEVESVRAPGRTVTSARDVQLHLLYNFNQETLRAPAFALRPEVTLPAGGLGSEHVHGAVKLILSKTVGRNRLHLNGSYGFGATESPGRGGGLASRFFYGAAYERTLPLKFLVLLAGVHARKPMDGDATEVVLDFGTRVQLNPGWVLDAGVSTGRLRSAAGHDFGFTFGLSRAFSFRALFPRKARTP
jgi:hypothetical protein